MKYGVTRSSFEGSMLQHTMFILAICYKIMGQCSGKEYFRSLDNDY